MENAEEVLVTLEEWGRRGTGAGAGKTPRSIPRALEEYLAHVARTGDPVFAWGALRPLLKEKLAACAGEFREASPGLDVPPAPNLEPFDYEAARAALAERLDSFAAAPFTVQRLCELLAAPRAHYARIDKFMRALEKNVLVVSTREPGPTRRAPDADPDPDPDVHEDRDRRHHNGALDVDMEETNWRDADPLAGASPDDALTPSRTTVPHPGLSPPEADQMESDPAPDESTSKENITDELQISKTSDVDIIDVTHDKVQEKLKSDPTSENVEMDVSKEQTPVLTVCAEDVGTLKDSEPVEPLSPKRSTVDINPEPMAQESSEQKAESITSGDDSSSSNSSENTDGDSERGGGDTTPKSPERSGASEEESSSCDVPENDDSKLNFTTNQQLDAVPAEVKIQSDNYTVADVHSNSPKSAPTIAEPPVVHTETTVTELPTEPEPSPIETVVEPVLVQPIVEPMQAETTKKPDESQST